MRLQSCEIVIIMLPHTRTPSVFPKLLLNLFIFTQLYTFHLWIVLYLLLLQAQKMRCPSLWPLPSKVDFISCPFSVSQFPIFSWAMALERWEEKTWRKNISSVLYVISSHQKFLSKGVTLSGLCFRSFFCEQCGRWTGGGRTWRQEDQLGRNYYNYLDEGYWHRLRFIYTEDRWQEMISRIHW